MLAMEGEFHCQVVADRRIRSLRIGLEWMGCTYGGTIRGSCVRALGAASPRVLIEGAWKCEREGRPRDDTSPGLGAARALAETSFQHQSGR